MKQPERYFCDVCGAEIKNFTVPKLASGKIGLSVPVVTHCEWTEGRSIEPTITTLEVDICNGCHMKTIGLECGYRGENLKLRFEEGGKDVEG